MPQKIKNFRLNEEDKTLLNDLVERSDAENASQWLRRIIRSLSETTGNYFLSDIDVKTRKRRESK